MLITLRMEYDFGEGHILCLFLHRVVCQLIATCGILLGSFWGGGNSIYAIEEVHGNIIWNHTTGGKVSSSPSISIYDDEYVLYVGSQDNNLYSLAIERNGSRVWNYTAGGEINSSPSVDAHGNIYFASYDNFTYSLDPNGELRWKFKTDGVARATVSVDEPRGHVVIGDDTGTLYCLNAQNGTRVWRVDLTSEPDTNIYASVSIDNMGLYYVGTTTKIQNNGAFYILHYDQGDVIVSFKNNDPVIASAAISDGNIYLATLNGLYLYQSAAEPEHHPWYGSPLIAGLVIAILGCVVLLCLALFVVIIVYSFNKLKDDRTHQYESVRQIDDFSSSQLTTDEYEVNSLDYFLDRDARPQYSSSNQNSNNNNTTPPRSGTPELQGTTKKTKNLLIKNIVNKVNNSSNAPSLSNSVNINPSDTDGSTKMNENSWSHINTGKIFKILNKARKERWFIWQNDLQIEQMLARGGSGTVYKATWRGVQVAVKSIGPGMTTQAFDSIEEAMIEEFIREITVVCSLRHPNIIQFYGATIIKKEGSESTSCAIVTRFCKKGSLWDVLRDKNEMTLNWNRVINLSKDIACGMSYLHSMDPPVLHRDLKSPNIVLSDEYTAMITDFGLSRNKSWSHKEKTLEVNDNNTTTTTTTNNDNNNLDSGVLNQLKTAMMTHNVGSPFWMSPEVIQNLPYGEKSDVYSFGIVLWELLTRSMPFQEHSRFLVYGEIVRGSRPIIPDWTPKPFEELIRDCWIDKPASRPNFETILKSLEEMEKMPGIGEHLPLPIAPPPVKGEAEMDQEGEEEKEKALTRQQRNLNTLYGQELETHPELSGGLSPIIEKRESEK